MNNTIETTMYVEQHRQKVLFAAQKISEYVNCYIPDCRDVQTLMTELLKRAAEHDKDKLENIDTLSLYSNRDELTKDEKDDYYELHKEGNSHHGAYYQVRGTDMPIIDILEFICDNYSSTLLRDKPVDEEILEEKENLGFSKEYLEIILNTFAMLNYKMRTQVIKKYPRINKTNDILMLIRRELFKHEHKPFITKFKED